MPVRQWNELVNGLLSVQETNNRLQRIIWQTTERLRVTEPPRGFQRTTTDQGLVSFAPTRRVFELDQEEDEILDEPFVTNEPVDGGRRMEVAIETREVGVQTDEQEAEPEEQRDEPDGAMPNFTKGRGGVEVCSRCGNDDCFAASPECKARESMCYHCQRRGHYSRICPTKRRTIFHFCKEDSP